MDKRINKKRFKEPRDYVKIIILYSFLCIGALLLLIYTLNMSETEIIDVYENLNLIGDAKMRSSRLFQKFIVKYFGKKGLVGMDITIALIFIIMLYSEISEYRRYKHKCKLYQEGIIKNIFDIYDDGSSYSILGGVRNLFRKKRIKYPSKKEVKQTEKDMEDYFKNR